jgi:hypothetical protein
MKPQFAVTDPIHQTELATRITRQFGYKHTKLLCQQKKKIASLHISVTT